MSDREMLELAAKAAGIDVSAGWSVRLNAFYVEPEQETGAYAGWNPLTDGGDALQLMVGLRLEPRFIDNSHSNGAEPSRVTLHNFAGIVENIDGDPLAATRRAIVRAAAEIGRQMP